MKQTTGIYNQMATGGWKLFLLVSLFSLITLELSSAAAEATGSSSYNSYLPLMVSTPAYFVATTGNDSTGNGSAAQPWATINHAVTAVPDGSTILVRPGTYIGQVDLRRQFNTGITIRAEVPYQSRLRHDDTVLICFYCRHIIIEGFDISHSGPGADRYVIQIQDALDNSVGGRYVTLRNNVLHDSYNNDILKINNGAQDILVESNIFYNQSGQDEHIDLNSVTNVIVQDNIFFNDFAGSGRTDDNTANFIVIKDSNGAGDGVMGSHNITVRRNIFFNWEGEIGSAFVTLSDNSQNGFFQAYQILIENNLMIGNVNNIIHAPLKMTTARDVVFRNNTVVGDLPSKAFAFRLTTNGDYNENIQFYNNIWSDPTGTMGSEGSGDPNKFAESDGVSSFALISNLYWNGGEVIPSEPGDPIRYTDDPQAVLNDPGLSVATSIALPRWDEVNGRFADNSTTIREAFNRLVLLYGTLPSDSAAIDQANPAFAPAEDILGTPRQFSSPDIGAYEYPLP